jgi:hypothetical protein
MYKIFFTHDWNGKLGAKVKYFTTIRKSKNGFYREGLGYEIWLNNQHQFNAELKSLHTLEFGKIHPNTIMIDTGYSYDESCKIFMNFLKVKTIDELKSTVVDHLLLQRN